MNQRIDRAVEIMESTADWLEATMPDGDVSLYGGQIGDYQMLVGELRLSIIELTPLCSPATDSQSQPTPDLPLQSSDQSEAG